MCNEVKCDSKDALKGKIAKVKGDVTSNDDLRKKVYLFTFSYYLEPGMKNIDSETAAALWPLVMNMGG